MMVGRLLVLVTYNASHILRSRREFVVVPLISTVASMLIVPYGLKLFTNSPAVGRVVATGLLMGTLFLPSTISGLYTVIELSVGSLDRYLLLPIPRHYVILSRLLATSVINLIQVTAALTIAALQGVSVSAAGAAATYALSFLLSLGVTGIVLLLCVGSLDPRKVSLIASITNVILLNLSPLYFPLNAVPPWLRAVMLVNPATSVIECVRSALTENTVNPAYLALAIALNTAWLAAGTKALVKKLERI